MKRREALEAYRRSRARQSAPPEMQETVVATETVTPRPSKLDVPNPATYATRNVDAWIESDNGTDLVAYYGLLANPIKRQKVLTWAIGKAKEGNLEPLLAIGIEDIDPGVQKRIDGMLETLPGDVLLNRIAGRRFTIKERRTVAGLLGRCKDPEAGKILSTLSRHSDSRVRESALQALAHFPVTKDLQFPIFKHHVDKDTNQFVRLRAAEGLAVLGTSEALIALELAARKDDASAELQAVYAGFQARRRPRQEEALETDSVLGGKAVSKEKKDIPVDMIVKVVIFLAILGFAGYRLSPPIKRWYQKTFPSPPPAQTAPSEPQPQY